MSTSVSSSNPHTHHTPKRGSLALTPSQLSGVYTALITPMLDNGEIDWHKVDALVEEQINAGVAGLVPCGTTGQSATLSHEEHIQLAVRVCEQVAGRCQVIVSAGSNNTREAIYLSNQIEEAVGPVTLLHVTGYYNCPPQEGIIKHFHAVAEGLTYKDSNIIIYNVPARTACPISAETLVTLAQHEQIVGVKEVASTEQAAEVASRTRGMGFRVLSGEDPLITAMMRHGATGTISGGANLAPKPMVAMVEAALRGEYDKAQALQDRLESVFSYVYCAKNPIPLAYAFKTNLRLPLCYVEGLGHKLLNLLDEWTSEELGVTL